MATLSAAHIDELSAELQSDFSSVWEEIPVTDAKFRAGLVNMDTELEAAEITIFQNISDVDVRAWLQANQSIGRAFIERTERKRKEVL